MHHKTPTWACAFALAVGIGLLAGLPATARIVVQENASATPSPDNPLTVVLADGWELVDVRATWHADDGLLVVERADGAQRTLRPEDLAGLRDRHGQDITASILPRWALDRLGGTMPPAQPRPEPTPTPIPIPVEPPAESATDPMQIWWESGRPVNDEAPAEPVTDPDAIFGLGVNYSEPHDRHFGNLEGGLGVEVLLRLRLGGPFYLSGGYLHQTLEQPAHVPLPPDEPLWDPDGWTDDPATIGGPWAGLSLVSTARQPNPVRFYLEAGLARLEVQRMPLWSHDDAYLGYRLAAGFLIPLGPETALNLGLRALHVENLDFGPYTEDDGHTMLGAYAGLSLLGF